MNGFLNVEIYKIPKSFSYITAVYPCVEFPQTFKYHGHLEDDNIIFYPLPRGIYLGQYKIFEVGMYFFSY